MPSGVASVVFSDVSSDVSLFIMESRYREIASSHSLDSQTLGCSLVRRSRSAISDEHSNLEVLWPIMRFNLFVCNGKASIA